MRARQPLKPSPKAKKLVIHTEIKRDRRVIIKALQRLYKLAHITRRKPHLGVKAEGDSDTGTVHFFTHAPMFPRGVTHG